MKQFKIQRRKAAHRNCLSSVSPGSSNKANDSINNRKKNENEGQIKRTKYMTMYIYNNDNAERETHKENAKYALKFVILFLFFK